MKNKILLLGLFCCSLISAKAQVLLDKGAGKNSFPIVSSSTNAVICFDGKDATVVRKSASLFVDDVRRVTGMSMKKEPGWCSTAYRKRYKRMNVSFNVKKDNENAVRYITVIYPVKKSADAPKFDAKFKNKTFDENGLEIEVKVNGKKQSLKYKL